MISRHHTFIALVIVIALGCALRLVALDRIPGSNGDEAWFGVNVEERLAHRPAFERTPSGLPLDPFHIGPLEFIARISPPSFWALRFPAALWNVLAVVLAYPLLAGPLGRCTAFVSALLIAVSPPAIAYSRISWEPSETVFFSLLVLGLAARGRIAAALFAFACSLLAHPTNVFLFPILAGTLWSARKPRLRVITPASILAFVTVMGVGLYLSKAVLVQGPGIARGIILPHRTEVWTRAVDPQLWMATIRGIVRLLTGVTTSQSIAGPLPSGVEMTIELAGFVLILLPIGCALLSLRKESARRPLLGIALGFVLTAVAFHLLAGPRAIASPHERYALVFVVSACVLIALLIEAVGRTRQWIAAFFATAWTALNLYVFVAGYAVPFLRGGGNGHITYRTGSVEPKKAVFDFVLSELDQKETAAVLADSWWSYWPLRYLATAESNRIQIEPGGFRHPPVVPPGAEPSALSRPPSRGFAVAFTDSSPLTIPDSGREMFVAKDPRGSPILHVFELRPATEHQALSGRAPASEP